jgi:hypothetical protein
MGADRYQILPISQIGSPKAGVEYNAALVIDMEGSAVFACLSDLRSRSNVVTVGVSCLKENIEKGNVPPGPAAVPPATVNWNDQVSFWKIDATSGDVTYCGTFEQAKIPQHGMCYVFLAEMRKTNRPSDPV